MKFATSSVLALAASVTLGMASAAQATPLGLNTNPAGWNRGDADTAYAVWDTFDSFEPSNAGAGNTAGFSSVALTQSTPLAAPGPIPWQGEGVYDHLDDRTAGDDLIYTGGRGAAFSLVADTSFEIGSVYLQVKRSGSTSDDFETTVFPTLNGISADSFATTVGSGDTNSDEGNYTVTTWSWSNSLVAEGITNLTLAFNVPTHRGVDAIVIDTAAVPEPASLGLLAVGGLLALRRRRQA